MISLEGRVAITGASRGIGTASCSRARATASSRRPSAP
jgi:NAD(P)-dependent dehydrogenase (short-subunit alcohol dehydrogenase family)